MRKKINFGLVGIVHGGKNGRQHAREVQRIIEGLMDDGVTDIYSDHLRFAGENRDIRSDCPYDHADVVYRISDTLVACEIKTHSLHG